LAHIGSEKSEYNILYPEFYVTGGNEKCLIGFFSLKLKIEFEAMSFPIHKIICF
jgi:hypothetical protein